MSNQYEQNVKNILAEGQKLPETSGISKQDLTDMQAFFERYGWCHGSYNIPCIDILMGYITNKVQLLNQSPQQDREYYTKLQAALQAYKDDRTKNYEETHSKPASQSEFQQQVQEDGKDQTSFYIIGKSNLNAVTTAAEHNENSSKNDSLIDNALSTVDGFYQIYQKNSDVDPVNIISVDPAETACADLVDFAQQLRAKQDANANDASLITQILRLRTLLIADARKHPQLLDADDNDNFKRNFIQVYCAYVIDMVSASLHLEENQPSRGIRITNNRDTLLNNPHRHLIAKGTNAVAWDLLKDALIVGLVAALAVSATILVLHFFVPGVCKVILDAAAWFAEHNHGYAMGWLGSNMHNVSNLYVTGAATVGVATATGYGLYNYFKYGTPKAEHCGVEGEQFKAVMKVAKTPVVRVV